MSTASDPLPGLRRARRVREGLDRARNRCLIAAQRAERELRSRRERLARKAWNSAKEAASAIRGLVDLAIAEGAWASVTRALEDGRAVVLAADGARIRALHDLAEQGSPPARSAIHRHLVQIARRHPEISDTTAWVLAWRAAKGRSQARFAGAAIAAAGRSGATEAILAALEVAPEPVAERLTSMAVARVAHGEAGLSLDASLADTSAIPAACAALGAEGARKALRALLADPESPPGPAAPFVAAARVRLLARATALLPEAEAHLAAGAARRLVADFDVPLRDEERDTVVLHLEGADLEEALRDEWRWSAGSLAVRLSALGRAGEARSLLERTGGGWYTAQPALRAASFAPDGLGDLARASVRALAPDARARLCGEHPIAAVSVLGAEEALRFAGEAGDETGQYVRIVALARIAGALPEPMRREAAARAARAYHEDPDFDALRELTRCARWMPETEAAWLLFGTLGRHDTARSVEYTLIGYSGVGALSPLVARAAGDAGLRAAADAVVAAAEWA